MTFLTHPSRPLPQKILIANRGEIAVRIMRACADLGIASVAVYSPSDRDALHAERADEAFALNGDAPEQGYLDIDQLLAVAQRAGADAVHPGYGFLAENAEFAERVLAAELTWIGPSPDAIRRLGDKLQARALAAEVGAPLVAGTPDPVTGVDEVLAFVDAHGLPVAIKAAYGGGGRGIKVVHDRAEVAESYDSAVREAIAAFGRGECFVETFLATPRHVETQCIADVDGNVAVISTRDCSLQRRNQKVVEEAPAPTITPEQLARLEASSADVLRAAGYVGAATCEFLVDGDRVTFLEVNTRIQVEHPVSEEVSGVDLIASMIAIASGARIESVPEVRGHSLEFRINAEDVAEDFAPAPGTLTRVEWPSGPGIRIDTGYRAGDTIPTHYDSLIAKLIVTAETRDAAIKRARRALAETVIDGVPTTLDFHRRIVDEPVFVDDDGRDVYTRWIDTHYAHSGAPTAASTPGSAARLTRIVAEVDGRRLVVVLPEVIGGAAASAAGDTDSALAAADTPTAAAADAVRAGMGGTVVRVAVADGDRVTAGDTLAVVEAMKMERPVRAPHDGVVSELAIAIDEQLQSGSVICRVVAA
ncbi:acetyl/propionyl/methylcrotonyl-CoA carboxylase subunit alpha [Leucobacter japonicus]|uniref:acetyl/propionyl/methylcrotonyl-CoA carboxylase subunit alpha n=1 Tax=Leucobacter japonicus TaxID=1461259 RepID=UPI0006A7DF55|nr:biotin carboxylase N-terminal domain-containing protein [Leucobacter japonicus]